MVVFLSGITAFVLAIFFTAIVADIHSRNSSSEMEGSMIFLLLILSTVVIFYLILFALSCFGLFTFSPPVYMP